MSGNEAPAGPALRAAREAKGTSIEEVAAFLKVSETIVRNIEEERFDVLPPRVFTRAFIRRYAELMALDPDATLWDYDQRTMAEPTEVVETPLSAPGRQKWTDSITLVGAALMRELRMPGRQSWVFGGTVVLIMALSGLFLWLNWPPDATTSPDPVAQAPETTVRDAPPPAADSGSASVGAPLEPREDPLQHASVPAVGGAQDGSLDSAPNAIAEQDVPVSNPLTYVPGDTHQLFFRFSHDCWVVVADGEDAILHQDLERAGDELYVSGDPPFTITLGYSSGVSLEYNGEPVMLAQHSNDNVAKLVLGR